MDALTVIAGAAGLFAGLAIALAAFLVYQHTQSKKDLRRIDRERQLLLNKAFVRDGQAGLIPQAIVNEGLAYGETPKPTPAIKLSSPFSTGLRRKREEIERTPAAKAADNLPETVKANIQSAAAKARSQEAA